MTMLSSIPSPGSNTIGPFNVYGLMIALGVLAAVWLAQKRWAAAGHNPEEISAIAMWTVPAGLVGARLYHVVTDWRRFEGQWLDVVKIWEGGLGIPGGIAAGIIAGVWYARRTGIDFAALIDAVVPALPLAQAIGRWGNWFNQELFGEPTDLPWGVEIDLEHRSTVADGRFAANETFHPTFLYESLWNLGLVGALLLLDRWGILRKGRLVAGYLVGYGLGRLWIEALRIDDASLLLGVRVNIWMSLLAIAAGLALGLTGRRHPDSDDEPTADETAPADA